MDLILSASSSDVRCVAKKELISYLACVAHGRDAHVMGMLFFQRWLTKEWET